MERRTWLDTAETTLRALLGVLMTISVVSIFWQVVSRYVLHNAPVWSEEVARYSLIWMTMVGAAVATRKGGHLLIDSVVAHCSPGARKRISILLDLLVLAFCSFMTWLGAKLTIITWKAISPGTKIPMAVVYVSMPLGFFFMALFTAERLCPILLSTQSGTAHVNSREGGGN